MISYKQKIFNLILFDKEMQQEVQNQCELCKLLTVNSLGVRDKDPSVITTIHSFKFKVKLLTLLKSHLHTVSRNNCRQISSQKKSLKQLEESRQKCFSLKQNLILPKPSQQVQFASRMHYKHKKKSVDIASLLENYLLILDFLLAMFVYSVTTLQITYLCLLQYQHYYQISPSKSSITIVIAFYSVLTLLVTIYICFNWKNELTWLQRLGSAACLVINILIFPLELFLTTILRYRGLQIGGIYLLPHQEHNLFTYTFFIIKTVVFLIFSLYYSSNQRTNQFLNNLDSLAILFSFFEIACYPIMDLRYYMNIQPPTLIVSSVIRDVQGHEIEVPQSQQLIPIKLKFQDKLQASPSSKNNPMSIRNKAHSQRYVQEQTIKL